MSSLVNDNINLADLNQVVINSSVSSLRRIDPVTKTSAFVVNDMYDTYICDGTNAITVTLPLVSLYSGRVLHFRNAVAVTNNLSASIANVFAIGTTTASANIMVGGAGAVGKSATLISNGTNWVIIRYISPA